MKGETKAERPARLAEFFAASAEAFSRLPLPAEAKKAVQQDLSGPGAALDKAAAPNGSFFGDVLATLYAALDLPLEDLLRSAWSSLVELQEYRDALKHPPAETSNVRFGKHRITSKHHPKVELLLNDREVASLTFDVVLALTVTGTTLVVRAGRIWQARGSEFQGDATLGYRGVSLMQKKTGTFTLPGAIDFEDGIPIPPLPKAAG